jgi:hypothetical protein
VLAVAVGVGVYYGVPHTWLKVVWGIAAAAAAYLGLASRQRALGSAKTTFDSLNAQLYTEPSSGGRDTTVG